MAVSSTRDFTDKQRKAPGMGVRITRLTATAAEQTHTLSTRCLSVRVSVPTDTEAGAAQVDPYVRYAYTATDTDPGGDYQVAEAGREPVVHPQTEADTMVYQRHGGANVEFEVVEVLG